MADEQANTTRASAHGSVHVEAGELEGDPLVVWYDHDPGRLGLRVVTGVVDVWLGGTPEEIDAFLTDVRCALTAAVAAHACEAVPA